MSYKILELGIDSLIHQSLNIKIHFNKYTNTLQREKRSQLVKITKLRHKDNTLSLILNQQKS